MLLTIASVGFTVALAAAPLPLRQQAAPAESRIQCEFRIFEADQEVSAETTLKIYSSGKREGGSTLGPADRLQIALPSGLYDVQAVREREGKVVSIKWAERLVVMHYPDEAGFHLEVINFAPGYGALQLRPAMGSRLDLEAFEAHAARPGVHTEEVGRALRGEKYLLLVMPSGTYDVQLRSRDAKDTESGWLTAIEVPTDRTRLKSVTPPARR